MEQKLIYITVICKTKHNKSKNDIIENEFKYKHSIHFFPWKKSAKKFWYMAFI